MKISFSTGVPIFKRLEILELFHVKEVDCHTKYLGLPTIIGRSKKDIFSFLKERISNKIEGWKERLLSRAGKEVLLKAVVQVIPIYMMSIFKISDGIKSMMAWFQWDH